MKCAELECHLKVIVTFFKQLNSATTKDKNRTRLKIESKLRISAVG